MPRSNRIPRLGAERADASDYTTTSAEERAHTAELSLARMERAVLIPRDRLQGMLHQPRQSLREDEALHELARSIASEGLLQPLVAAPDHDKPGYYLLIAGHRRLAAAGLLARQEVELPLPEVDLDADTAQQRQAEARAEASRRVAALPATLRDVDADTAFALSLVENLQRDDLTRREVMDAVKRLRDIHGWSVREISRRTGRSHTDLSRLLRIAEDGEVAALVADELISATAAGPLVEQPNRAVRGPVLAQIRARALSTLAEVEAALAEAHARRHALTPPASPGEEPVETGAEEPTVESPAVAHMSQLTITKNDAAAQGATVETATPTPRADPVGREVPVSAHTRRVGRRGRLDPVRAERLAREMVQVAHENLLLDPASRGMLWEAVGELRAYLEQQGGAGQ